MKDPFLNNIENILDEAGFISVWNEEGPQAPFQFLNVTLTPDTKERNRNLIIKVEEDIVKMPVEAGPEYKATLIQMVAFFPFKVDEGNVWEVLRMVNFYNMALPTPGIILDEGLKRVLFRYTFHKPQGTVSKEFILSLVGMVLLWMDAVSGPLEETCSGKKMMDVIKTNMEG